MTGSNCIPDHILSAFLEGHLSDEEAGRWEEHLLRCVKCLERTRDLSTATTAANLSHQAVADMAIPAIEALMQRLSDRSHLNALAAQSKDAISAESLTVRPDSESVIDAPLPRTVSNCSPVEVAVGEMFGPYRIIAKLGEGGMGAVYKATHVKLDKLVAVKVLSPQVTKQADAVTRFEREMRAVGKLNHPHIVQAYDAGEISGTHYLTMEFVEGTDLHKFVKDRGPMSVINACKAIRQSALALSAAHAVGLIHRDIKPSNLLVGRNGQIKVLDLGLALLAEDHLAAGELTTAGQAFGTPDYMAPEQWEDAHSVDARTDLYALGCTLYFLLVGHSPYATDRHRTAVAKMKGHVNDPIPDLKSARADVPDDLVAIYRKLMAKSPADRYSSAMEVAQALAPFTTSRAAPTVVMPMTAASDPSREVTARLLSTTNLPPTKGHRRLLAAAGGGFLLLAVIVMTITSQDGKKTVISVPEGMPVHINAARSSHIDITEKRDASATESHTPPAVTPVVPVLEEPKLNKIGWQNWPADAPKPAIAPFDAVQANKHQEEWATYLNVPVEYINSIGMKFRLIPPGEFMMGSTPKDIEPLLKVAGDNQIWRDHLTSEMPRHRVILTKPLYFGVHEVTQKQYATVMGNNPSAFGPTGPLPDLAARVADFDTASFPVETIDWNLAAEFCEKLSQRESLLPNYQRSGTTVTLLNGTGYRMPTEAEWENACRAGTTTRYWNGDTEEQAAEVDWSRMNGGERTHAVGELKANPFGLYDMHGNVSERVDDYWDPQYYEQFADRPALDPTGPGELPPYERGIRGCGWYLDAFIGRCSARHSNAGVWGDSSAGIRVVLPVKTPPKVSVP